MASAPLGMFIFETTVVSTVVLSVTVTAFLFATIALLARRPLPFEAFMVVALLIACVAWAVGRAQFLPPNAECNCVITHSDTSTTNLYQSLALYVQTVYAPAFCSRLYYGNELAYGNCLAQAQAQQGGAA